MVVFPKLDISPLLPLFLLSYHMLDSHHLCKLTIPGCNQLQLRHTRSLLMQVLCIHVGDVVEIDLSDGDKERFAVMEVTELFEDTQVCEQSAHYTQSTLS